MKINWDSSCKKIIFTDHKNNSKIFDLKEDIVLNIDTNIYTKNNYANLKDNPEIIKISKINLL